MKSKKLALFLVLGAAVILTVIWSTRSGVNRRKWPTLAPSSTIPFPEDIIQPVNQSHGQPLIAAGGGTLHQCSAIPVVEADIDTANIYPTLNFNAKWISQREYWSEAMEKRYLRRRAELWPKIPLKVIVMPHSHNDPGWLKTYEGYFHSATKFVLDNAVDKLTKYTNMTFIWTEISFLSLWWKSAHPTRKANLRKLLSEGRLEILTGGWVMTDEANVHLFAMVDQLIEGHQWLLNNLNVKPRSSWSVDPFGHGSAFPYVLKASGVDSMVIMRIHYAWKEWFAKEQSGDFMWRQNWDPTGKDAILCHNFPFDIYSVKGSCGPQSQTCLQFNFAQVPGRYSEYSGRTIPVTASNIRERSELILDQWGKTGSLFPHNVVLVPLGDDFTYSNEAEWDQQYSNYNQIMEYINSNGYEASVQWGTLTDYFNAVHARTAKFDTLTGDFFVYSDVFSDGVPAYWSGYYSTRPFMKKMSRELEASLRTAEILFTWSFNLAARLDNQAAVKHLEANYVGLTTARANLALFQHHDAITGTAKQFVVHDYGEKLFNGIIATRNLLKNAAQFLLLKDRGFFHRRFLESDYERPDYGSREKPLPLDIRNGPQHVVVINSLGQDTDEVVSFFLDGVKSRSNICVRDQNGLRLPVQFNPTWSIEGFVRLETQFMEISFLSRLPALSITKFTVHMCSESDQFNDAHDAQFQKVTATKVYCLRCPKNVDITEDNDKPIILEKISDGGVVISNANLELIFDEDTHLLATVTDKRTGLTKEVKMVFGGYPTIQFRNGAYLFKPDTSYKPDVLPIIDPIDNLKEIVIISGPVFSEISLIYEAGVSASNQASFVHTMRLYHTQPDSPLSQGIYIENNFNFADQNNFRDVDMFMRLQSGLKNRGNTWYSDSSGLSMQKRTPAVNASGLEGNTYPITSTIYLEDSEARLTLLVDHATGASSQRQGWLEVIVDRRASYDDARGMGEGILDSRDTQHRYWLLFEAKSNDSSTNDATGEFEAVSLPSRVANQMTRRLNYPPTQFVCSATSAKDILRPQVRGLDQPLPDDLHLFNLRTFNAKTSNEKPSKTALMILHRQGEDCQFASGLNDDYAVEQVYMPKFSDLELRVSSLRRTSLTGNSESSVDETLESLRETNWTPEPMRLEALKLNFD